MIRCLAIDDEPLALSQLVTYINKVPFLELVGQCESAIEARRLLDTEPVDAIFCDINMPDLNGMDFVKSLAVPPLVVFTTAYSEFATPHPSSATSHLFIKTDYRTVKIVIQDIRYIEGMSEYLKIHLDNQPKPVITLLAMKMLMERLPQNFMRIHRSYIVNLDKIVEVSKNRVILDNNTYLPIGDSYREQFNKYLDSNYIGKQQ